MNYCRLSVILTTKTSLHKYQLLLNFLLKTRAYSFLLPGVDVDVLRSAFAKTICSSSPFYRFLSRDMT
ncbi:hypothetical protein Y032_0265g659 [Ancylostoma ceylanicum]|uniref:Uncharacterized protein n=1 Tax=Ancylostoma ceylanicum TaxID=53326 RepID=A0A016SAC2_9BILA|nr:hypothetical protein Y032_0265g659 [Ancylostoma ceylanicum]